MKLSVFGDFINPDILTSINDNISTSDMKLELEIEYNPEQKYINDTINDNLKNIYLTNAKLFYTIHDKELLPIVLQILASNNFIIEHDNIKYATRAMLKSQIGNITSICESCNNTCNIPQYEYKNDIIICKTDDRIILKYIG
jgi:hypothetical protein